MSTLVGLPKVTVSLDGSELTAQELVCLTSVRVQQRVSTPTVCELVFTELKGDRARDGVAVGSALEVRVKDEAEPLFVGEVTAVGFEHGPSRGFELRVRAYDPLHRLRKRQPVRTHVELTVVELATELVADAGLSVSCSVSTPLWKHVVQHRQSDFDLLLEQSARAGLYFTLRGQMLHLATLEGIESPVSLSWGEALLEGNFEVNADGAVRSVSAEGWNAREVNALSAQASSPRVGRSVRVEASPSSTGGSGERVIVDQGGEIEAHVELVAQAELDRRAAREVSFRGVARGDVRLKPLTRVDVQGVAAAIAGTYVLTEATHTITAEHGFLSELSSEPPKGKAAPTAATAALGIITRVDSGSGRVKARLPTHGDVETDWMQVLSLGAGEGKGLTLVPDVDDHVLLLFAHEDPSQGVVVGGLYGKSGPPDSGIEQGGVRRYTLQTRGGHKLRFDDAKKVLRLEDPTGSFFELSPEGVTLQSKVPLTLEAPGQPIVIRGDTVDFKRG